jgi:hypothetical protein
LPTIVSRREATDTMVIHGGDVTEFGERYQPTQ